MQVANGAIIKPGIVFVGEGKQYRQRIAFGKHFHNGKLHHFGGHPNLTIFWQDGHTGHGTHIERHAAEPHLAGKNGSGADKFTLVLGNNNDSNDSRPELDNDVDYQLIVAEKEANRDDTIPDVSALNLV